jgi:1-acyl-sn-glycerol-3-phosphate acyltransferase
LAIADKDTYETDRHRSRSLFSRLLLSPKFTFYPQVFSIIWRNASKAKKGHYGGEEWVKGSLEIFGALENVGVEIEITGMDNMRKVDGPAVFISNHMGSLETFILPSIIQPVKLVTFVVKESLVTVPVFGHVMRSRDPIVVGRKNPRQDLRTVLDEGVKKLDSGISLVIFPQSTRSVGFDPERFNTLGIKLASKAGVPVVPIALKTDAWGIGKYLKDFGPLDRDKKVYFSFGKPMKIEGRGVEEHERVVRFIKEKLEEWGHRP